MWDENKINKIASSLLIEMLLGIDNPIEKCNIICEIVILLFQIVTLPVEFDASRRALKKIKEYEILDNKELSGGQTMLTAAALTYVASVASTIIEIFRLILIYGRRDDRN